MPDEPDARAAGQLRCHALECRAFGAIADDEQRDRPRQRDLGDSVPKSFTGSSRAMVPTTSSRASSESRDRAEARSASRGAGPTSMPL
jgi:hypothetical protein